MAGAVHSRDARDCLPLAVPYPPNAATRSYPKYLNNARASQKILEVSNVETILVN